MLKGDFQSQNLGVFFLPCTPLCDNAFKIDPRVQIDLKPVKKFKI